MLHPYNASLNNEVALPPPVKASNLACYNMTKTVCADHLHNISDCRSCKSDPVTGAAAWLKLKPVCGGRPINNFHDACEAFFPAKIPMRGSLAEVLVGQGVSMEHRVSSVNLDLFLVSWFTSNSCLG